MRRAEPSPGAPKKTTQVEAILPPMLEHCNHPESYKIRLLDLVSAPEILIKLNYGMAPASGGCHFLR
jgi:hypothetical protein